MLRAGKSVCPWVLAVPEARWSTPALLLLPAVVILWLSSERGSSNLVSLQHWASTRWCERGRRSDANLDRTSGERVKRREKTLSGFGHRVYKNSDPRSFIVRNCGRILQSDRKG
ncbi:hypothetical protein SCP_1202080 [Sparassis crispa]|uniref:Citrate synthase n=1 Tax=Sparassis crispa TaxID=139825 RepID=A0A401H0Q2_9APHY|nr:hypothetical protein SCP_1202080 [Sparassis crispa]GBE87982.1 hypothetical protein SCP_1202080 [Sparassis crispa]